MIKTISFGTIAAATLAAAIIWYAAEPAEAKDYQFCRTEPMTSTRLCNFDTMEQCVAAISGLSGSCTRDPFYATGGSFAYAPKGHGRSHRKAIKPR
ncbi:hypothetical protein XI09_11410 [Bradyrhizobium sp. CCBAU 11386]|uniref:DUF3551 domain-containing protein n=1 Tax=Bradyrhizobium sp. CCBAU 11386 TaxID=1630837 RepID=UPI002304C806|nr:DUF3551 domain-containing protein [Bradyrhizobium sp. CCBAU 11386]MDA9505279.1 hypothetical protein [Bradyrhizobium sp. CCBAU 11386]